jgi:hypothetical protein
MMYFLLLLALAQGSPCDGSDDSNDFIIFASDQEIPAELRAFFSAQEQPRQEPFFPGFRSLQGEPLFEEDVDDQFQQLNMIAATLFAQEQQQQQSSFSVTFSFEEASELLPAPAPKVERSLSSQSGAHHNGDFHEKVEISFGYGLHTNSLLVLCPVPEVLPERPCQVLR